MKKTKKTGLGRGISALIPDIDLDKPETSSDFFFCAVGDLSPNRYQPRTRFSEEELARLTTSIAQQGVLQPLLARNIDGSYELIAGERRLRAAKAAGLTEVPVIILDLTDEQVLEVSIIENIQRENLNVLEEAEAYFRLIDEFGYTQEKVARKIGKNRSTIANLLRLRSLPQPIKESLIAEKISMGHARPFWEAVQRKTSSICSNRSWPEGCRCGRPNGWSTRPSSSPKNWWKKCQPTSNGSWKRPPAGFPALLIPR